MNVLVTGAGGMVGSHMVEILSASGNNVVGLWHKNKKNIEQVSAPVKFVQCDMRYSQKLDQIIFDFLPEQIYHLAAQSYPTVSWDSPIETIDVNINSTINIFEAIKKVRKYIAQDYDPIVVVACSSAEYGETLNQLEGDDIYVKESAELRPLHPYGVSKVGQDLISYQYYKNDNIKCIRARIFNSTGTRKVNDVTSDFTHRAVEAEKNGSYEITVGRLNTKRAIMDQRDLINALLLLAEKGVPGEVYNVSSEFVYEMQDIIELIEHQIGHKLKTVVDPSLIRPTDEKIIIGDISKLKRDTNWKQEISMDQTISDMFKYWRIIEG